MSCGIIIEVNGKFRNCGNVSGSSATTREDCETKGHCWHPGISVGSFWCCRCNTDQYPESRIARIPNIRAIKDDRVVK